MENRYRDERIELRLTKTEKDRIYERMNYCNMPPVTRYIRNISTNGCILVVDHSDIKQLIYELNQIGKNINQIAHKVNGTGDIKSYEIEILKEDMDKIWQLLKSSEFIQL